MPREKQEAQPVELKDEELKGLDGGTLTAPGDARDDAKAQELAEEL